MLKTWEDFTAVWVVDYEFYGGDGSTQIPICYVGRDLCTNKIVSHWIDGTETKPLYSTDDKTLFIAYATSAEIGCHLALGFDTPSYILDLYSEFRCRNNGKPTSSHPDLKKLQKYNLLSACFHSKIPTVSVNYKELMRDRILRGPPFTHQERKEILQYCREDVKMETNLFIRLKNKIELPYAILRGRYTASNAKMEYNGIPIDIDSLIEIRDCWDIIKEELIFRTDKSYHIYEEGVWKHKNFLNYLKKNKIPWELTKTGLPRIDRKYMEKKAKSYPQIKPLQELRYSLNQLKLENLKLGKDNRHRCFLSYFGAKTSRNTPSSAKYIFGPAVWIRSLIKPPKGMAVSYIDYNQEEIGIAAALSKDRNLLEAFNSGDPYIAFAKETGAVPQNATKKSHPDERAKYKIAMLAMNYGQGYYSLAENLNILKAEALNIINAHQLTYRTYWKWIENFKASGMLSGKVKTKYHWYMNTINSSPRSLQNWPMQSTGAEILRLAISMCFDYNIKVLAPIHDAILIEDTIENIDKTVKLAQECMEEASRKVLGLTIKTDAKIVRYPDRYMDKRGEKMWNDISDLISNINPAEKKARIEEKILEGMPIDKWVEKPTIKPKPILSKKLQRQRRMQPQSISEREMIQRIKKISGFSHMEIMHLVNEARDTDFDLEHEVDWRHEGYDIAKRRIQQKRMMKDVYVKG